MLGSDVPEALDFSFKLGAGMWRDVVLVAGVPPSVLHRPSDSRVSFHSFSGGLYKGVVDFVLWKGVV